MLELTLPQARSLQILSLGLGRPRQQPASKEDLLAALRGMGVLQIDTIHIISRSHYVVMWSRLGDYPRAWLDELLAEGRLFEYWAHAACLIPVEDFPLLRPRMIAERSRITDEKSWYYRNAQFIQSIREHLRENGAMRSADFKPEVPRGGTWWDWKAEKSALEQLYDIGEVMVARREKFQRVYDLAERIYPQGLEQMPMDWESARRMLLEKTVRILGVTQPGWVADYYRYKKSGITDILKSMEPDGTLVPVRVAGWKNMAYIHRDNLELAGRIVDGSEKATGTHILSPFDPLVWDRTRLKHTFGMDFQLECYLRAGDRKYGYWLLPVLQDDEMTVRMDVKANRQAGVFEVKGLFPEPGIQFTPGRIAGLAAALRDFARWHGLQAVSAGYCPDEKLKQALQSALDRQTA